MNGFEDLMIAEGAVVSGNVSCGKDCSIWYNATVRGDSAELKMGSRVNVQESAVLHLDAGYPMHDRYGLNFDEWMSYRKEFPSGSRKPNPPEQEVSRGCAHSRKPSKGSKRAN